MKRTCLWITAWALAVLPSSGHADCLTAEPMLLWSYPADGDVEVPINAQVWILSTLAALASPTLVSLNGETLTPAAAEASATQISRRSLHFVPSELAVNTRYTLRVVYAQVGSRAGHTFELNFTTGSAYATTGRAARVAARSVEATEESRSEPCAELRAVQGCFDTIEANPPQVHRLDLRPSDAIAWFVRTNQPDGSILWPSSCGAPRLLLRDALPDECFFVRAVARGGLPEPESRYCAKASAKKHDLIARSGVGLRPQPPRVESVPETNVPPKRSLPPGAAPSPASEPSTKHGLCAAAQPGRTATGWTWLGVVALLVLVRSGSQRRRTMFQSSGRLPKSIPPLNVVR